MIISSYLGVKSVIRLPCLVVVFPSRLCLECDAFVVWQVVFGSLLHMNSSTSVTYNPLGTKRGRNGGVWLVFPVVRSSSRLFHEGRWPSILCFGWNFTCEDEDSRPLERREQER